MKKMLLIAIMIIANCMCASRYMIDPDPSSYIRFEIPNCENREKLLIKKNELLNGITPKNITDKKFIERNIEEFKRLFFNDDYENFFDVDLDIDDINGDEINLLAEHICKFCSGIPEAAYKIQVLYDDLGKDKHALLWAIVNKFFSQNENTKYYAQLDINKLTARLRSIQNINNN